MINILLEEEMIAPNRVAQQPEDRLKRAVRGSNDKDAVVRRIRDEFPDARIVQIAENGPRQWRILLWPLPDEDQFDVICDR